MTVIMPTLCRACQRLNPGGTCAAFPDGIPFDIIGLGADHRQPIEGDHGLRFVQRDGAAAEELVEAWRRYRAEFETIAAAAN